MNQQKLHHVIIGYPLYYALKVAAMNSSSQLYKRIELFTVICSTVLSVVLGQGHHLKIVSSQVSKLCANELLFCRLIVARPDFRSCLLLKSSYLRFSA
jgi:hypothetical protein